MKVFRKSLKKPWGILLLAVAVMMVPYSTEAGVKKIWPDKFIPLNNAQNSHQYPNVASSRSSSSGAYFYANLKLPAGTEIKKLVYYHRGSGTPSLTVVTLSRQKLGKEINPPYIIGVSSEDSSGQIIKVPNGPPSPTTDLIVRNGYRYFLTIFSQNLYSAIFGIKVFYQ